MKDLHSPVLQGTVRNGGRKKATKLSSRWIQPLNISSNGETVCHHANLCLVSKKYSQRFSINVSFCTYVDLKQVGYSNIKVWYIHFLNDFFFILYKILECICNIAFLCWYCLNIIHGIWGERETQTNLNSLAFILVYHNQCCRKTLDPYSL